MSSEMGTLYGIGVGPGDPEWITVKGLRLLQAAPVVCFPAGKDGGAGYAHSIVAQYLDAGRQELVPLSFPMSRKAEVLRAAWEAAGATVAGFLEAGRDVAFLTEGDPLFYSTFIYLAEAARVRLSGCRVVTVPGVTSLAGCASAAGLPLALANEHVAILPAPDALADLDRVLDEFEVVVVMKAAAYLDRVLPALQQRGLLQSAVLVERCGTGEERVIVGEALAGIGRPHYLSTLIICRRDYTPFEGE